MKYKKKTNNEQIDELLKQANACYIHRQIIGEWNIEHATEMQQ